VIDDETEIYLLNGETECGNLSPAVTGDHFASTYGDMSSWDLSAPVILPGLNNEGYPVQTSQMKPPKRKKMFRVMAETRVQACIIHESLRFVNKHPQQKENLCCRFRQGATHPLKASPERRPVKTGVEARWADCL
jgi:hypothetical protein